MDVATYLASPVNESGNILSYDNSTAYEQQIPTTNEDDPRSNLASRIGTTKIYLLAEAQSSKRKREDEEEIVFGSTEPMNEALEDGDIEMEEIGYRANAIFLQGAPISHLPTARLFAYAKHFDTTPLGLEWVNDQTCILVYKSNFLARTAFGALQKSSIEDPDPDEFVTAKPIPISLWPAEARINKTLGKSEGLKGVLRMRWAKPGDVKKRGAKKESEFYKRHGVEAGKESFNGRDLPPAKRARKDDVDWTAVNEDTERQRLDAELDQLRQASDIDEAQSIDELDEAPASPPSKMRSDYIAKDGKTLIDRFSDSNLFDFNPKKIHRLQGERGIWKFADDREEELGSGSLRQRLSLSKVDSDSSRRSGGLGRHNRDTRNSRSARRKRGRSSRQKMTQQELDDELDALKQKP